MTISAVSIVLIEAIDETRIIAEAAIFINLLCKNTNQYQALIHIYICNFLLLALLCLVEAAPLAFHLLTMQTYYLAIGHSLHHRVCLVSLPLPWPFECIACSVAHIYSCLADFCYMPLVLCVYHMLSSDRLSTSFEHNSKK